MIRIDWWQILLFLLGLIWLGSLTGCAKSQGMTEMTPQDLKENLTTIAEFMRDNKLEGDAELVLSPDGCVMFGTGLQSTNQSYVKARIHFDSRE